MQTVSEKPEYWIGYGYSAAQLQGVKEVLRGELKLVYSHFAPKPNMEVFEFGEGQRIPFHLIGEVAAALGWKMATHMSTEFTSPCGVTFASNHAISPTKEMAENLLPLVCAALKSIGNKYVFLTKQGIEKGEMVKFELAA